MRCALKYINRCETIKELVGAEIGVREGKNALDMLQSMNTKKVYLVDHWTEHIEHSGELVSQHQQNEFYRKLLEKIEPFKHKVEIIRKTSEEASKDILDESLDFVYLDGDHRYDAVKKDMSVWLPKLHKQGWLCGHDFNNSKTPEVRKAVTDFCRENNLIQYKLDDIDWIAKRA